MVKEKVQDLGKKRETKIWGEAIWRKRDVEDLGKRKSCGKERGTWETERFRE